LGYVAPSRRSRHVTLTSCRGEDFPMYLHHRDHVRSCPILSFVRQYQPARGKKSKEKLYVGGNSFVGDVEYFCCVDANLARDHLTGT
jgi:hypothetical protein